MSTIKTKPRRKPAKPSPCKAPAKARRLQPGDIFRLHPDCCIISDDPLQTYEVLRVNDGSATCRSLAKRHTTVTALDGSVLADFWKSGRPFHISPTASVILIHASFPGQESCSTGSQGK